MPSAGCQTCCHDRSMTAGRRRLARGMMIRLLIDWQWGSSEQVRKCRDRHVRALERCASLWASVTLTPSFVIVRWDFKIGFLFSQRHHVSPITKRKAFDNCRQEEKRKVRTMRKRNGTHLLSINHEVTYTLTLLFPSLIPRICFF
jgi:hypothetical protein